jgi:hypothetical protein
MPSCRGASSPPNPWSCPPSPGFDVAPLPPRRTNKAPIHAQVPVTKGLPFLRQYIPDFEHSPLVDAKVGLAGAVGLAVENKLGLAGRIVIALLQVSNVGIPNVPGGLVPPAAPSPLLSVPPEDLSNASPSPPSLPSLSSSSSLLLLLLSWLKLLTSRPDSLSSSSSPPPPPFLCAGCDCCDCPCRWDWPPWGTSGTRLRPRASSDQGSQQSSSCPCTPRHRTRCRGGGVLAPDEVFHLLAGALRSKTTLDPAVEDLVHHVIGPRSRCASAAAIAAAAVLCIHAAVAVVPTTMTTLH